MLGALEVVRAAYCALYIVKLTLHYIRGEEGSLEMNNVLGLVTEDGGRQLRRTKDALPGQVKMESMKMETCHMAEHCRERGVRDRPKFGFGYGFGAETDLKCSFGSVSVTVPTPHFTFGFGRNYTAADRNWPKLE